MVVGGASGGGATKRGPVKAAYNSPSLDKLPLPNMRLVDPWKGTVEVKMPNKFSTKQGCRDSQMQKNIYNIL